MAESSSSQVTSPVPLGISVAFLFALIGLLFIGVIAVRNFMASNTISAERKQVRQLLVEMKDLFSSLQEAETSQRGYLLTGDEHHLAPYLTATESIAGRLEIITRLTAVVDPGSTYPDEVRRLIDTRMAQLARTIAAHKEGGAEVVSAMMRSGEGKRAMDDIRRLEQLQEERIESALASRIDAAEIVIRQELIAMVTGVIASLTVLTISYFGLRHEAAARQHVAATLAQRQAVLTSLFEISPDVIGIANTEGYFTQVNHSFVRMLGWSEKELTTQPFLTFVHPDDVAATIAEGKKLARGVTTASFDNRYRCKDGTYRWLNWSCQPQPDGTLHAIGRDFTEAKRAAELLHAANVALRSATEQAQAADRLKSAFLATMSHELRTPLNSIIGFTGILLQGLAGPLNAEQVKQLGMVRTSSRHLLALINDVLDLSKIEAGQLEVTRTAFALDDAVATVVGLVTPQAQVKGLRLRVEYTATVGMVVSDRRRVEQVLLNLLSNAIKFTDQGEVVLTVGRQAVPVPPTSPVESVPAPRDFLQLAVTDTGIGIANEHLPTLFQPFRQLDSGLARTYQGTGLGLAICRRLLDLLGGAIRVESRLGHGSVFTITLPLSGRESA